MKILTLLIVLFPGVIIAQSRVSIFTSDTLELNLPDSANKGELRIYQSKGYFLACKYYSGKYFILDSSLNLIGQIPKYKPNDTTLPYKSIWGILFLPKTNFYHTRFLNATHQFQYLPKNNCFVLGSGGSLYVFDKDLKFKRYISIKSRLPQEDKYLYKKNFFIDEDANVALFQTGKQHKSRTYHTFYNFNTVLSTVNVKKTISNQRKFIAKKSVVTYPYHYQKLKYIPYLEEGTSFFYDKKNSRIMLSVEALSYLTYYNLNGDSLYSFGEKGKHINYNEQVLDTAPYTKNVYQRFMIYRLKSAEYNLEYVDEKSGNIYRTYYSGINDSALAQIRNNDSLTMIYPLSYYKKLYLQIYNASGKLLYDDVAPSDPFNIFYQRGNRIYTNQYILNPNGKSRSVVVVYELKTE